MNCCENFSYAFQRRADAEAIMRGSKKYEKIRGRVSFYQLRGGVLVRAELIGLPEGGGTCESPIFALHIHEGEACDENGSDAFGSAGQHYDPSGCHHPFHAGDLLPLFGVNGRAFSAFFTGRFSAEEILGKTLIIHALPDDFVTQPSGASGERIACGVIESTKKHRE